MSFTQEEFKSLINDLASAWNRNDARAAADLFSEDAIYSNIIYGKHRKGREELFQFLAGKKVGRNL